LVLDCDPAPSSPLRTRRSPPSFPVTLDVADAVIFDEFDRTAILQSPEIGLGRLDELTLAAMPVAERILDRCVTPVAEERAGVDSSSS
jgi:hypothetical protein